MGNVDGERLILNLHHIVGEIQQFYEEHLQGAFHSQQGIVFFQAHEGGLPQGAVPPHLARGRPAG